MSANVRDSHPRAAGRSPNAAAIAIALAALLVLTRFGHFGELSRLPDASWAVFFLGGLALRDARAFAGGFALAWLVDLAAIAMGTPADCFSPAYLFLVPAYGALWWAGRLAARLAGPVVRTGASVRDSDAGTARAMRLAGAAATLPLAVVVAFVVSNAGVLWLGGGASGLTTAEYAVRVLRYLPGYLLVTLAWTSAVLAAHAAGGRLALSGRAARGPGSA